MRKTFAHGRKIQKFVPVCLAVVDIGFDFAQKLVWIFGKVVFEHPLFTLLSCKRLYKELRPIGLKYQARNAGSNLGCSCSLLLVSYMVALPASEVALDCVALSVSKLG